MAATLRQHATLADDEVQFLTFRRGPIQRRASTETLGRQDEIMDEIIDLSEEDAIDLTISDGAIQRYDLREEGSTLSSIRLSNEEIHPNTLVEIQTTGLFNYKINFILVKAIVQDGRGSVVLRGIPFTRNRNLADRLPKKLNEVCEISNIDLDKPEDGPAFIDAPACSFVKVRKMIKTNAMWPAYYGNEFVDIADDDKRRRATHEMGILYCRWQFTIISVTQGRLVKPVEEALRRFSEHEVEPHYRVSDETLRMDWRGDKTRLATRRQSQKYTVFDSFSGAGGVSRGAQMAGLRVIHAVDNSHDVWPTYEANFPDARLFRGSVYEFIATQRQEVRADILHLSPPCQFFSPAHTRSSSNDDQNIFSAIGGVNLISKVKPRLLTLEETFGILHSRHQIYFNSIINDFTSLGFSVRWKVVRLCTWGSAQDRKRLIIVGAAPGENLPPFPKATHSQHGQNGTRAFNTMGQALAGIRLGDSLHDIRSVKTYNPPKRAYDPNRLAGTLTTSGANFCYPDGTRDFTLREFAALQGFPRYHQFLGGRTSIKRQIGNAFPPNTVRVLYEHLKAWLLEQDSKSPAIGSEVIMIDAPAFDITSHIILDDSDNESIRENRRELSTESQSSSGESIMRDIQDVIDHDDDIIMVNDPYKPIDLT